MKKLIFSLLFLSVSASYGASSGLRGTVSAIRAQDTQSVEVVRTTIRGAVAKAIFEHLSADSVVLPGQDGEQTTKEAKGVTCGHINEKKYFCSVDFSSAGIED